MMLGKSTEYAIRALVYIAMQNGRQKRPGCKEVAKEIGSPEHFTAKILQQLVKHGVINSAKGRGGGFFFEDLNHTTDLNFTFGMSPTALPNRIYGKRKPPTGERPGAWGCWYLAGVIWSLQRRIWIFSRNH